MNGQRNGKVVITPNNLETLNDPVNTLPCLLSILVASLCATLAPAQDAAPADRNAINTRRAPAT